MDPREPLAARRLGRPPRHRDRLEPGSQALYECVLDADDDLAARFDAAAGVQARPFATARVLQARTGACDLTAWFEAVGGGFGLLILDGVIAVETRIGDRTAARLKGAGDLLQPRSRTLDELLEHSLTWRALLPMRFALLDEAFVDRVRPWPQIALELLRRTGRLLAEGDELRAITGQPRLELRLVLLLWHLAGRWGRVEPTGIRISLPLTHRLLGRLVGAERPSVSHALARLTEAGLVSGRAAELHLHGTLEQQLGAL